MHITPIKTNLSIKIIYDGQRKRYYEIQKTQTIVLVEEDWKKIEISVVARKTSDLSMMKIEIDTIKTEFKSRNSYAVPPQKKIV